MTQSNILAKNLDSNFNFHNSAAVELEEQIINAPMVFQTRFSGIMEMYGDEETVSQYLNDHQGWFIRCAQPMKVTPFGQNGYTLSIGNYGAFGYHLEPEMSVMMELPESRRYSMYSVPNPQVQNLNYEVEYRSDLSLESIPVSEAAKGIDKAFRKKGNQQLPQKITKINWQLDLRVHIQFPAFIYRLPISMIRSTGNRVLAQIVQQISPRLSHKVQKDFHARFDLPMPTNASRSCQAI